MTDLTEKWKKGELPNGWYWVKGIIAEGIYAYTAEYLNNMYRPRNGERIIEQVPTYQEYLESKAHCAVYSEENKQLRALLKECRGGLIEISKDYGYCVAKDINKIIAKIDGCENILEGLKNVK